MQDVDLPVDKVESRASLTISREWDNNASNPRNWNTQKKWILTGYSCFLSLMVGINALSIASAASDINEAFGVSDATFPNSYWTVTAWNVGAMVGPVLGLPLMENFGVRLIYFVSDPKRTGAGCVLVSDISISGLVLALRIVHHSASCRTIIRSIDHHPVLRRSVR